MKKTVTLLLSGVIGSMVMMSACSKSSKDEAPTGGKVDTSGLKRSKYVFVYTGQGTAAGTYIVTADDVTKGSISSTNNGVETDAYSFIIQNNTIFAQVYGAQGPVTPYRIYSDNGQVGVVGRVVNTFRTGVYGTVNSDFWVGGSDPRGNGVGELFLFDAVNLRLAGKSTTDLKQITGTGDNAVWTGVFQVDNKLYMPFYKFKPGANGSPWDGQYGSLDSSWVAVFSYPGLKFEKVIGDDRTSFIGNWFGMHGLRQIENGDVYAWSTAGAINGVKSKKPSGIVRIKKGTEQFDKSYFFNVEEKIKSKIARGEYIANGKFLLSVYNGVAEDNVSGGRIRMVIADVINQTITEVKGIPEHDQASFRMQVFYEGDGKTIDYVMEDDNKQFYVYVINAETATAVRGLHIQGASNVTSIARLKY
ncbi:DUF4374 domain-containing protein [Chitinophaga solisilvae]|uniref:DUF4374 domain-containing protein n=1 Tax=Chitinophaga solisilvae TaxID=1233460 RepID=UPI00136B3976|nr:DUF4374 domain-containing protein [Chitinophaga solisilvae]